VTGVATIHIKHEDLSIDVIIRSGDSNGVMVHSSGNGDFEKGFDYYIPYSNISWIKYPKTAKCDDDEYIGG